jgi:glycosyltransferase involved in cell wall biosynthesis
MKNPKPLVPLTAVVTTFNNAQTLAKCLSSLAFCDSIIVLDSGSEDSTIEIAKHHSAVIFVEAFKGYGPQKQSAIDKASTDWVLLLDADEFLSDDARTIIRAAISDVKYQGYRLPRREWLMWRWPHKFTRSNWQLRLFNKTFGAMNAVPVHAAPEVRGNVKNISPGFYHFGEKNLAERVDKINRYSTGMIQKKTSKPLLGLRVLIYPSFVFIRFYVFKRYFLNGWAGYLAARTQAFYAFLKYAKRIEMKKARDDSH